MATVATVATVATCVQKSLEEILSKLEDALPRAHAHAPHVLWLNRDNRLRDGGAHKKIAVFPPTDGSQGV